MAISLCFPSFIFLIFHSYHSLQLFPIRIYCPDLENISVRVRDQTHSVPDPVTEREIGHYMYIIHLRTILHHSMPAPSVIVLHAWRLRIDCPPSCASLIYYPRFIFAYEGHIVLPRRVGRTALLGFVFVQQFESQTLYLFVPAHASEPQFSMQECPSPVGLMSVLAFAQVCGAGCGGTQKLNPVYRQPTTIKNSPCSTRASVHF